MLIGFLLFLLTIIGVFYLTYSEIKDKHPLLYFILCAGIVSLVIFFIFGGAKGGINTTILASSFISVFGFILLLLILGLILFVFDKIKKRNK